MKRDLIYILIILFLGAFIWFQIREARIQREFTFARNIVFNNAIEKARQYAQSYADSANDLRIRHAIRHQADSVSLSGLKMRNSELARKLDKSRKPVQSLADTVQPLRDYLILADSLLAGKDSLIYEMELRHSAQIIDLNQIINTQAKQILSEKSVSAILETRNKELEKDLAKSQRGKKVRNYVIAGLISVVLYQLATK